MRAHFDDLFALLERYDDNDPNRPIHTPDIFVMSERLGWHLLLRTTGPYWRAEGAEPDVSYRGLRAR